MMQGWVAPAPPAATPYNVGCANGHRLRGNRTEGYQALRCPTCGEAVFVLPHSPLPLPPVPASAATPSRPRPGRQALLDAYPNDDAPHALVDPPAWPGGGEGGPAAAAVDLSDDVADIDWVDDAPAVAPIPEAPAVRPGSAPAPVTPQRRPARPPAARPTSSRPAVVAPAAPAPPPVPVPRLTWREWASKYRNPLLAVGLVLVIVGAVSLKRWRQRLEELPRIAEIGRTEGFKKLDAGDFFAAKKILADAAAAVDAMGGRFEGADKIRQAAQEAAIFTDLVPQTLEDLVEEAATYRDVGGWSDHFAAIYRGRSIILETTITAIPDSTKPGSRYGDAYQILVGRGPKPEARGRLDYAKFALFDLTEPKVGEIKLFGARLAALEFDIADNIWVITLEPDSGVFMTHPQALEAIHWPAGEPVEEPGP